MTETPPAPASRVVAKVVLAVMVVAAAGVVAWMALRPGPDGVASATPTPTAAVATSSQTQAGPYVLTVDGIGPYRIGQTIEELLQAGLLEADTNCGYPPSRSQAQGYAVTGMYKGVYPKFSNGRLVALSVSWERITSPDGARYGMTVDQLKSIYGARGEVRSNGAAEAFVVSYGTRVELYELYDNKVSDHIAGEAAYILGLFDGRQSFTC